MVKDIGLSWSQTNKTTAVGTARSPSEPAIAIAAPQQKCSWKALLRRGELRVKALSPRAVARLQGVPGLYQLIGTKSQQVTILGNGVPPVLIEKMWHPILKAIS
ncbi:MAG: hypothetical protein F6J93_27665 [Oscillatoria sp. SIO1A7]|nr:hypothetical protein [Oscillatoria sp. SIO1A7]